MTDLNDTEKSALKITAKHAKMRLDSAKVVLEDARLALQNAERNFDDAETKWNGLSHHLTEDEYPWTPL